MRSVRKMADAAHRAENGKLSDAAISVVAEQQRRVGLLKAGGYVVLVFAALGVYLFFGAASAGTGGKPLPLGKPLLHG